MSTVVPLSISPTCRARAAALGRTRCARVAGCGDRAGRRERTKSQGEPRDSDLLPAPDRTHPAVHPGAGGLGRPPSPPTQAGPRRTMRAALSKPLFSQAGPRRTGPRRLTVDLVEKACLLVICSVSTWSRFAWTSLDICWHRPSPLARTEETSGFRDIICANEPRKEMSQQIQAASTRERKSQALQIRSAETKNPPVRGTVRRPAAPSSGFQSTRPWRSASL